MSRTSSIVHVTMLLTAVLLSPGIASAEPPNIVMILADDQGWGDLSINGNTNLSTPSIDSIAKDGALFDYFYVCPVCAPTRAEMLTGRYHPRGGVRGVSRGQERLNPDESTLAESLNAAGYATGLFGKWHNGTQHPYHPNSQGFDEFYGFTSGHWGNYFDPMLEHNGEIVRGEGFIIDDLTMHALDFIQEKKDEPFFCYLAYNTPHSPFQVPDKFYDKFRDQTFDMSHRNPDVENIDKTRAALAMVENIDWNVGRILQRLKETGNDRNTIVIYFSDNGPNSWRWNGDMKGRKGSTDEGGVRVPCFVKWPEGIAAGTRVSPISGTIDFLPTLLELTGVSRVGDKPLDGRSVAPLLLGQESTSPDRMLFSAQGRRVSVRTERFRYDHEGNLFDLQADPGQRDPANDRFPEAAATLSDAVAKWSNEVLPKDRKDPRPFLIGGGDFLQTVLPARDGVESGNIERSNRAPNCSYFTNWIDIDDRIEWNVQVAKAGQYEVTAYYTCPEADVGSTIELSFSDASVQAKVSEAHDPPAYGFENDRVSRGTESFVKDFKPMLLGTITLEEAIGTMTLRAIEIPGESAMEIRGLILRRIVGAGD